MKKNYFEVYKHKGQKNPVILWMKLQVKLQRLLKLLLSTVKQLYHDFIF